MLFSWIRNRVRDAFLAGISDGVAELEQDGPKDTTSAIATLRVRLTPALPAPAPSEPEGNGNAVTKKGKSRASD